MHYIVESRLYLKRHAFPVNTALSHIKIEPKDLCCSVLRSDLPYTRAIKHLQKIEYFS